MPAPGSRPQLSVNRASAAAEYTATGHERWPVCRVGLTGNTGMKDFNRAMLEFFAHPGHNRGTASQFATRALDSMTSCETRLLIIDFTDRR